MSASDVQRVIRAANQIASRMETQIKRLTKERDDAFRRGAEAMRLAARAKVREIGEQQEAAGHYGATSVAAVIVAALITLPLPEPK